MAGGAGQTDATTTPTRDFEPDRRPLRSFVSVTRGVLLSPARFFAGIRTQGLLKGPIVYAAACAAVSLLLAGVSYLLLTAARGGLGGLSGFGIPGLAGVLVVGLVFLVLSPLIAIIGLYVGAAIYQVLVRIFVGAENAGYYATLRVTAYAAAVTLLSWIPLVGLLAGLWGVWVNAAGIRELHRTTTTRALLVAAVPYAVSVALLAGQVAFGELSAWDVLLDGGLGGPGGRYAP